MAPSSDEAMAALASIGIDIQTITGSRYPNQSKGDDGLPAYVDGESIAEADLVAWYTMGFHHVTRPEDWPILSTVWQAVKLRPHGFFTRNPGLGVRRRFLGDSE